MPMYKLDFHTHLYGNTLPAYRTHEYTFNAHNSKQARDLALEHLKEFDYPTAIRIHQLNKSGKCGSRSWYYDNDTKRWY